MELKIDALYEIKRKNADAPSKQNKKRQNDIFG